MPETGPFWLVRRVGSSPGVYLTSTKSWDIFPMAEEFPCKATAAAAAGTALDGHSGEPHEFRGHAPDL